MELAKFAKKIGADYKVEHATVLNFVSDRKEFLKTYYPECSFRPNIGIAMWSHPVSGYLVEPELCNDIANLEDIRAIKYSVRRVMYKRPTHLAKDRIFVSTALENYWYQSIKELYWKFYLCSFLSFLLQTKKVKRIKKYTVWALRKDFENSNLVCDSLDTVRQAFHHSKPHGKLCAQKKYWQEPLGQVDRRTRFSKLELTNDKKKNSNSL